MSALNPILPQILIHDLVARFVRGKKEEERLRKLVDFATTVDELFGEIGETADNANLVDNQLGSDFDPFEGFQLWPNLQHEPGPAERVAEAVREAVEITSRNKDEFQLELLLMELGFVARNIRLLLKLNNRIAAWRLQVLETIARIRILVLLKTDRALGGDPPQVRWIRLETLNARMRADA